MAYSSYGGAITVPATAKRVMDLLIAAGALSGLAPGAGGAGPYIPAAAGPHYNYHTIALKADSGNAATVYLGHSSAMTNSNVWRTVPLAKGESYTEYATVGWGALETWWVVGNGSDTLYVNALE